jgi:hypothetical protein
MKIPAAKAKMPMTTGGSVMAGINMLKPIKIK